MEVRVEQLSQQLKRELAPVYFVSGDETLLVEEACDSVIAAARKAGFSERSVHHTDSSFKWHELLHDSASISLFAEKKILDVRAGNKKLDKDAHQILSEWGSNPAAQDTLLLVRSARLDARQVKTAWYKAVDKLGVTVRIWPVEGPQFPQWLSQRLRSEGLQVEADALQYLADRTQGNLLAAAQEVSKLSLLAEQREGGVLDLQTVVDSLEDASRFTSFDVIDAVFSGQPQRVVRVLSGLQQEGVAPIAILSAFVSLLRRGDNPRGLPQRTVKGLQSFTQRVGHLGPVLAECALIDQQVKGQVRGDVWLSLQRLFLRLAGLKNVPLPGRERRHLGLM